MLKVKKIAWIMFFLVALIGLTGCDSVIFTPKGLIAHDEKNIIIVSVILMSLVVVPVIFLTLLFAWRYRQSNSKAAYLPNWDNNLWIELFCWGIPFIIIAILGTITWRTSHRLDPFQPLASTEKPIVIQAVSLQWRWLFIYPEQHIATINYVQMPVNVPVRFMITAEGPMNSFQIPAIGGQIYAMAGMKSELNLIANEIGNFRGISANLTGEWFSDMKFTARATSQADFDQWVKTVKASNNVLNAALYAELVKQNKDNKVQYFSSVDDNLFSNAVMKYMVPMTKVCSSSTTVSM